CFTVLLIGHRWPMSYELVAALGTLPSGQTLKLFSLDGAGQFPLLGEPSLPFSYHLRVLGVVTLVAVSKLLGMVGCGLGGAQCFGDSEHGASISHFRLLLCFLFSVGIIHNFRQW